MSVFSQSDIQNKYNLEKEIILNVILNSVQFDSIYSFSKVLFVENELLSTKSNIVLERGKQRVQILNREKINKNEFVGLGDFILIEEDSAYARVQLYSSSTGKTLNVRLEKIKGEWFIVNHMIIDD